MKVGGIDFPHGEPAPTDDNEARTPVDAGRAAYNKRIHEAQAWLDGQRSTTNWLPELAADRAVGQAMSALADAAEKVGALATLIAHREGLI